MNLGSFVLDGLLGRRIWRRWYPGVLHGTLVLGAVGLVVCAALLILHAEGILVVEGFQYAALRAAADLAGLLMLAGTVLGLARRMHLPAYLPPSGQTSAILAGIALVVVSGYWLEGSNMALGYSSPSEGAFVGRIVMAWLLALPGGPGSLHGMVLWGHEGLGVALLLAAPFSRLRHAALVPLNTLLAPDRPKGALSTPFDLRELIASGLFDVHVGARAASDFSARLALAINSCVQCGRCQDVCPADLTGTGLSPPVLLGSLQRQLQDRNRRQAALDDVVGGEIWACTLCGACTEACPAMVHPPDLVVELRRSRVARGRIDPRQSQFLSRLGAVRNPYGLSPAIREEVPEALGAPAVASAPDSETVYWVGCAATYDLRARAVATATARILHAARVRFAVLGAEESCCGEAARRLGEEGRFQELALRNLEVFRAHGIKRIVTACAHCFNTLRNEYPAFGSELEVRHHAEFIRDLLQEGRIRPEVGSDRAVTLHDACNVGRLNGEVAAPRQLLTAVPGLRLIEMEQRRKEAFCCGGGGANYWYDVARRERMGEARARQAVRTGASVLAVECPFCLALLAESGAGIEVRDVAEIFSCALGNGSC